MCEDILRRIHKIGFVLLVMATAGATLRSADAAAEQYRASVGCAAATIESIPLESKIETFECVCYEKKKLEDCLAEETGEETATEFSPPPDIRRFRFIEGRDVDGLDLKTLQNVNLEGCVRECKANSRCKAFSFDKWNRYCFLKRANPTVIRVEPNSIVGYSSSVSPRESEKPTLMLRYRGRVFPDPGYRNERIASYRACESACRRDSQCEVFSYVKSKRRCKMIENPGEYFSDRGVDSGVKRQEP